MDGQDKGKRLAKFVAQQLMEGYPFTDESMHEAIKKFKESEINHETDIATNDANFLQVVEMNDDELRECYKKMTKAQLIEMLIARDRIERMKKAHTDVPYEVLSASTIVINDGDSCANSSTNGRDDWMFYTNSSTGDFDFSK